MMKNMYPIAKASEKALNVTRQGSYPWKELAVGQSFGFPIGEVKFHTMSVLAYKASKRLGKKFRVVDHGAQGIEVVRLPDDLTQFKAIPTVGKVEAPTVQPELDVANHWALRKDEVK